MIKFLMHTIVSTVFLVLYLNFAFPLQAEITGGSDNTGKDADGTSAIGVLTKADALIRQAIDTRVNSSSNSSFASLLSEARDLIRSVPPDQAVYQGHRKRAILEINAALQVINQTSPDETLINDRLRKADAELKYAIALKAKAPSASQ